ncbi:hypothetical protein Tco_0877143, partial [Tanacetum coccineum]
LSTTFKPKEPIFQVALDVLSLTPFYPAFLITASVPAVYMHEFWATASYHKHFIRFKLNTKSYSFDLDTFRNMLQMCLKLPGQKFVDPPFKEEILTFMRELSYSVNIKLLSDVKVEILSQPWRTFRTIINKCLSGKVTGLDTLRLSPAQILWGLYHQQKVDYIYLLWEDLVFQIENKESRKTKYMFYPRFTKYGVILPENLTTQAMKESEAYKTYYAFATGKAIPKPKYVRRSTKEKPEQAPEASSGKRLKATAKVTKSGKKKQPAKGLETLSVFGMSRLTMKLAIKESKTQLHRSQPNGSGAHEGTGVTPGVPDVPIYGSDEEQISWKSSEDDDDEANIPKDEDDNDQDDDERTESDNDGDDFVHPKLSTHDDEARKDDEVNEEESNDESNEESNEESDEEVQGANTEEEEMDEEATHEEDEANELYRDVNVNLEGRDTVMTDAPLPNVQATQETEDTHVILTALINPEGQQQSSSVSSGFVSNMLNPRPDTGIDSIFTLNTEATSLVDVSVTTIAEPPLVSATTLPPPPTPLITHMQQTPVPTPTTVPSTSLQDLPNFGSLFGFDHRLKTLETDFSEFKQTNQFAEAVSSIPALDDEDKDEEPPAGSNRGSKTRRAGKEPESTSTPKEKTPKSTGKSTEGSKSLYKFAGESAHAEEPMHTAKDLEEPAHQEFYTGATEDQPVDETLSLLSVQPWLSNLSREEGPRESFDELMDTPLDFLTFIMNRLKVDTLTPELLAGPTFEPMKGTCKSLVELEYFFEEVYKETTDQLDRNNPEG